MRRNSNEANPKIRPIGSDVFLADVALRDRHENHRKFTVNYTRAAVSVNPMARVAAVKCEELPAAIDRNHTPAKLPVGLTPKTIISLFP